jgi:hypothetical protein
MKGLMEDVNAGISRKQAIWSRITNLGEIGGRSGMINDDKCNERLRHHLELLASQAKIIEIENATKASKKKAAQTDLTSVLPLPLHWYNSVDANSSTFPCAFTKKCAQAVLFLVFGVSVSGSTKRQDLIVMIREHEAENPSAIHDTTAKHPYELSREPPKLPHTRAPRKDSSSSSEQSCDDKFSVYDDEFNTSSLPPSNGTKIISGYFR